jgi:4-azaleucine resistance transporter AzlC
MGTGYDMQNNNIKSNFFKGVRQALPIVLGYIPIGLSFGILAADTLRHTGIFLMSLLVYAGSAQFISVSMLAGQASAISVIVTVFLVNLRHLLFSASLSPYARAIPARLLALISFEMTDESFAVEIQEARKSSPPAAYYFGLHLTAHASWIAATVAGGMLGALIPDPAKWGIDFALPAMFIALLTAQVKRKNDMAVALVAGIISVFLALKMEGNWNVIIAAMTAASLGVFIECLGRKFC